MKTILLVLVTIATNWAGAQNHLDPKDLAFLDNTSWEGELMYVNYSDGQEVRLATNLQITVKNRKLYWQTQYPQEPGANTNSKITLSKDGLKFADAHIIEKRIETDGSLTFATQYQGKDDDRPATITITYEITESKLIVTKQVRYENAPEPMVRNRYTYYKR